MEGSKSERMEGSKSERRNGGRYRILSGMANILKTGD